jgi:hypothetical protein
MDTQVKEGKGIEAEQEKPGNCKEGPEELWSNNDAGAS